MSDPAPLPAAPPPAAPRADVPAAAAPDAPPPPEAETADAAPPRSAFAEALGGRRGVLDAGLATAVFVVVASLASTRPAAYAAAGTGLAVLAWRLLRRQPVSQAVSGLFGLAVAVVLALRFRGGDGSGFFLYGIGVSAVYAVAFAVSVALRRPLVGLLVGSLSGDGGAWRRDPDRRRAFALVTLGWALLFAVRSGVQGALVAAGEDVAVLGVAKLALGYPLTAAAVAASYFYLRSRGALAPPAPADTGGRPV